MDTTRISVAEDFSPFPAGRTDADGPYNGTKFREKFLFPALQEGKHVIVIFDGVEGWGSSFLEEAFGGLLRRGIGKAILDTNLEIVADEPGLAEVAPLVQRFIEEESART